MAISYSSNIDLFNPNIDESVSLETLEDYKKCCQNSADNASISAKNAYENARMAAKIVDIGVDPSLSIQDAAADSKVVGDKFNEVNDRIDTEIDKISETLDTKAPINNPKFTGTVTVDGEELASKSYVKKTIDNISTNNTGKVDSDNPLPTSDYKSGQSWFVVVAGTYAGQTCSVGDRIICVSDYNGTYSPDDFIVVKNNVSNGISSDASTSTDNEIVVFSGTSGKTVKNSGITLDILTTLTSKSHEHLNKSILDTYTKTETELLEKVKEVATEAVKNYLENNLRIVEC